MAQEQWKPPTEPIDTWVPPSSPISVSQAEQPQEDNSITSKLKSIWDTINTPLVDIRGGALKDPTEQFAAEHPIIGGGLNFLTDTISSLSSPLSLGLGGTSVAETAAAKLALPKLAGALKLPAKAASGGMILHGGSNLLSPESTMPERLGGLTEAAFGGLGLKGPKGAKPAEIIETSKLTTEPTVTPKPNVIDVPQKTLSPAVAKIIDAIESSRPLNREQQAIYHSERAERLSRMKGVTAGGEAGYHKQLAQLKGEHTKVKFEPIKLEQADVDELFNTISAHPASIGFNEINAKSGLAKLLNGQVPQRSELELLDKVFGSELTSTIQKNLPRIDKAKDWLTEAVNLPKSLMSSMDFSAPFRQGLGLVHKKAFWTSFDDMFKSFGSDDAFRGVLKSIEEHPNFSLAQESGLSITDLTGLTNREEAFLSNWAEKGIPLGEASRSIKIGNLKSPEVVSRGLDKTQQAYSKTAGRIVRASNRAYVGFLDKLRMDTFASLVDDAERVAIKAAETAKTPAEVQAAKMANPKINRVLAEELASFVNTATGRGSLGKLEQSAVALNSMLFSPRLIASRVKMLNPNTYIQASPIVRKEYLKSLLAIAGTGTVLTTLAQLGGAEVSNNPTSADFRKAKIGNTRLDPYGGFQQYIVLAQRLLSGEQTSSRTGNVYELGSRYGLPSRADTLIQFGSQKLAPVPKFAYDMLDASTGREFNVSEQAASLFIPMVIKDVYDLAAEDPKLIPLAVPASFGLGVQTY